MLGIPVVWEIFLLEERVAAAPHFRGQGKRGWRSCVQDSDMV